MHASTQLLPLSRKIGRLKYGISAYYHFLSCFQSLPIAALLKTPRGDIFCVHGGISPDLGSIHAIDSIDRRREVPTDGPLCDLLWSDPAVHGEGWDALVITAWLWICSLSNPACFVAQMPPKSSQTGRRTKSVVLLGSCGALCALLVG